MQKPERILESKNDAVFIIGNGFDLDLGLPTSYTAFAQSEFWRFNEPDSYVTAPDPFDLNRRSLHQSLHLAPKHSKWLDLELELTHFATLEGNYKPPQTYSGKRDYELENEVKHFNILVDALSSYLKSIEDNELKLDSKAAIVLKKIIENGRFKKIFTFNYTNLRKIADKIGIKEEFWYTHMHGNLEEGIILGIENQVEFCPIYRFMCKEYNEHYRTRFLNYCLQEAKEIVIFGHSLGEVDYHYFQSLFSQQSKEELKFPERKRITIFTRNLDSKMDILDQLRIMNNKRLDLLFGNNVLEIIRTDGNDEDRFNDFLEHISPQKIQNTHLTSKKINLL